MGWVCVGLIYLAEAVHTQINSELSSHQGFETKMAAIGELGP